MSKIDEIMEEIGTLVTGIDRSAYLAKTEAIQKSIEDLESGPQVADEDLVEGIVNQQRTWLHGRHTSIPEAMDNLRDIIRQELLGVMPKESISKIEQLEAELNSYIAKLKCVKCGNILHDDYGSITLSSDEKTELFLCSFCYDAIKTYGHKPGHNCDDRIWARFKGDAKQPDPQEFVTQKELDDAQKTIENLRHQLKCAKGLMEYWKQACYNYQDVARRDREVAEKGQEKSAPGKTQFGHIAKAGNALIERIEKLEEKHKKIGACIDNHACHLSNLDTRILILERKQ